MTITDPSTSTSVRPVAEGDVDPDHDFVRRHIGPDADAISAMLTALGFSTLDELSEAAVPRAIAWLADLDLPAPQSETEVLAEIAMLAARTLPVTSMIGPRGPAVASTAARRASYAASSTAFSPWAPNAPQATDRPPRIAPATMANRTMFVTAASCRGVSLPLLPG